MSAKSSTKMSYKSKTSTPATKPEFDSKRKKEIELVVPRKSVKSSDIREMTEEASKKQLDRKRSKPESMYTGSYKVGDLGAYVNKLTQLQGSESSKSNDELIQLLTQLFEEKNIYQSDAVKAGLPGIISVLRKTTNPTVSKTASAIRKHLMKILTYDSERSDAPVPMKKLKVEERAVPVTKEKVEEAALVPNLTVEKSTSQAVLEAKDMKANNDDAKQLKDPEPKVADEKSAEETNLVKATEQQTVIAHTSEKVEIEGAKAEPPLADNERETSPTTAKASKLPEPAASEKVTESKISPVGETPVVKPKSQSIKEPSVKTAVPIALKSEKPKRKTVNVEPKQDIATVAEVTKLKQDSTSPTESPRFSPAVEGEGKSVGPCLDRNREVFVEMLSKTLEADGPTHFELAKEIEV